MLAIFTSLCRPGPALFTGNVLRVTKTGVRVFDFQRKDEVKSFPAELFPLPQTLVPYLL